MMVESHQCPVGSYCCCQPPSSGSRKMMIATTIVTRVKTIPCQPKESVAARDVVLDGCEVVEGPAMLAPPEEEPLEGIWELKMSPESYSQNSTLATVMYGRTQLTTRCDQ